MAVPGTISPETPEGAADRGLVVLDDEKSMVRTRGRI
jgi:hypothetical protein